MVYAKNSYYKYLFFFSEKPGITEKSTHNLSYFFLILISFNLALILIF